MVGANLYVCMVGADLCVCMVGADLCVCPDKHGRGRPMCLP
ncbi:MAG: hypothetical protein ABIJ30_08330 [bacterium]